MQSLDLPLLNQAEYYGGDKRCHFLLSQVCVEEGFKGRMNDMGDYNMSNIGIGQLQQRKRQHYEHLAKNLAALQTQQLAQQLAT